MGSPENTRARWPGAPAPGRYRSWSSLREILLAAAGEIEGAVLDVGAGAYPTLEPSQRGSCTEYVMLDVNETELAKASPDSGAVVVGDVTVFDPSLADRFDLVLSCHTFEHVNDVSAALLNVHRYLRPAGRLLFLCAGRWSAHAVLNRLLPEPVGALLTGRPRDSKFPARYDRCYASALESDLSLYGSRRITPLYLGGNYWPRPLRAMFYVYENATERFQLRNVASHYLVEARR